METANLGWIISAIVAMSGFLAWFTKATVKDLLADFAKDFRSEFERKFQDAAQAKIRMDGIDKEVERLDKRITTVEDYAHDRYHTLANKVQAIELKQNMRVVGGDIINAG